MTRIRNRIKLMLAASPGRVSLAEGSRSAFAALVGLSITVGFTAFWMRDSGVVTLLPPLGASAVILFALPGSPLAQPWPFLGGSLLSALIGLGCAAVLPHPILAALTAVPLAMLLTSMTRSTHPPAAAQALLFASTGKALLAHGLLHAIAPLLANLAGLFLGVMIVNNLIHGRRYPALPPPSPQRTGDPAPLRRTGIQDEDLRHAMHKLDTLLDVSEQDLMAVFDAATVHAYQRSSSLRCQDIMSRDVLSVTLHATPEDAWHMLASHHVKALPVTDGARRVVGVLTRSDFLRPLLPEPASSLSERLRDFLRAKRPVAKGAVPAVSDLMQPEVLVAREDMPVMELVEALCHSQHRHVPVVDARRRLVGMITQSDLLAALFHQSAWKARNGKAGSPA
ncbi:MAG: HPP family protein [Rhodocyclaceae bacterium]|nr:HPP family protein [Rhodocyclaceae bacterium]